MDTTKLGVSEIKIPLDQVQKEFDDHLAIEGNEKILFSGKYGIGKSYFLKNYFESEDSIKKYNTITLSPINYVVSANEDIFELIKVDIIKQLFIREKLKLLANPDFLPSIVVGEMGKGKLKEVKAKPLQSIISFASSLTKLGVSIGDLKFGIDVSAKLIVEYSEYKKKLNEEYNPKEYILDEYAKEKLQAVGSFVEYNIISKAISDSLAAIKEQENKQNILVIEDFDRLDPAHIFRILNVFSAHNYEVGNKFGFDKIVIVCDLNNIKGLYEHLYGPSVDFEGYIDKFYSIVPFYFHNKRALEFFFTNSFTVSLKKETISALSELLLIFIQNNDLSLRQIIKTYSFDLPNNEEIIRFDYKTKILNRQAHQGLVYGAPDHIENSVNELLICTNDIELNVIIQYLKTLFGGEQILRDKLEKYLVSERSANLLRNRSWAWILGFSKVVIANYEQPVNLFFQDVNLMSKPMFSSYGMNYSIELIWKPNKKYNGKVSYYEDSTIGVISANGFKGIDIRDLVSCITDTMRFVDRNYIR